MTQVKTASDERLHRLQALMDSTGLPAAFTEFDPFSERHGSWERSLHSYDGSLDRYVIVALTSLDDYDEVSAMAGAEERSSDARLGRRFRRFDVGSLPLNFDDPNLRTLLDKAIRMAVEIQPSHLQDNQRLAS